MTINMLVRKQAILEQLKDRYERQGYAFFPEPNPDMVPDWFRGYRPDAIAIRGQEKVAIEVRVARGQGADLPLAAIAERFAVQSDWKLKVVAADDFPLSTVEIAPASGNQIEAQVREYEKLIEEGHFRVALILGWSILEAIMRALGLDGRAKGKAFLPATVAEALEQDGFVEPETGTDLRAIIRLRNAAVHGDFGVEIEGETVRLLGRYLRQLADRLPPAADPVPSE